MILFVIGLIDFISGIIFLSSDLGHYSTVVINGQVYSFQIGSIIYSAYGMQVAAGALLWSQGSLGMKASREAQTSMNFYQPEV